MHCCILNPFVAGNYLANNLKNKGISSVALLSDPSQTVGISPNNFQVENFTSVISIQNLNEAEIAEKIKPLAPYVIMAGSEYCCASADSLAFKLSPQFANSPHDSDARTDKMRMQEAIGRSGIPSIASHLITLTTSHEQLKILLKDWQWPVIVKPNQTSGTFGLKICHTLSEIEQQLQALQGVTYLLSSGPIQSILLQEFLRGEEYCMDTCSYQGQHRLVSLGYYKKILRNDIPVYRYIELRDFNNEKGQILSTYLKQVLNATGINSGLAHTEIMLTNRGPRLIEVNPRISGCYGLLNLLAKKAYLNDQISFLAKAIQYPKDFLTEVDALPRLHKHARLIILHCFENRKISDLNVSLLNQLSSYAGHLSLKKAGQLISGQATLDDAVALVQLVHTDAEVIAADSEQIFHHEANKELF